MAKPGSPPLQSPSWWHMTKPGTGITVTLNDESLQQLIRMPTRGEKTGGKKKQQKSWKKNLHLLKITSKGTTTWQKSPFKNKARLTEKKPNPLI